MDGRSAEERAARSLSILVVDDEEALRDVIAAILGDEGHHVEAVATLAEARDALARDDGWDILIADHRLEGENADSLLDLLADRTNAPSTILCSATPAIDQVAKRWGVYF